MQSFHVPLNDPTDLEIEVKDRFYVKSVLDLSGDSDIDSILDAVTDILLNSEDVLSSILRHDVFDPLYSLIKNWTILQPQQQKRLMELYLSTLGDVMTAVASAGSSIPWNNAREAAAIQAKLRAPFKAATYMFAVAVQVAEKTCIPRNSALLGAASKKSSKGGTGKGAKAAVSEDMLGEDDGMGGDMDSTEAEVFDWDAFREQCVNALVSSLGMDLRPLWPMGAPDEEWISSYVKTGFRLLNSVDAMKNKGCKRGAIELISLSGHRFPGTVASTASSLVNAITASDHAGAIASEIIALWGVTGSVVSSPVAASEVMRELGRINGGGGEGSSAASSSSSSSSTSSSASMRRAATFLTDAAERVPIVVHSNLAVLLHYLQCDAYTMRSALVTALARVITHTPAASISGSSGEGGAMVTATANSSSSTESTESAAVALAEETISKDSSSSSSSSSSVVLSNGGLNAATRARIFQVLLRRILDVHSFTRAATLKAWGVLIAHACIPSSEGILQDLTRAAVGRLRDKGAIVRRAAGGLLRSMVEHNPFGPQLDARIFQAQAKEAKKWLDAKLGSAASTTAAVAIAASSEVGVIKAEGEVAIATAVPTQASSSSSSSSSSSVPLSAAMEAEVVKWQAIASGCASAITFCEAIASAVTPMSDLLRSSAGSDVMESIRFLSLARSFSVPGADLALGNMLTLVWSQDENVKEEVIKTFDKLYILNQTIGEDEGEILTSPEEGGDITSAPSAAATESTVPTADEVAAAAKNSSTKGKGRKAASASASASSTSVSASSKKPASSRGKGKRSASIDEGDEDNDDDEEAMPANGEDEDFGGEKKSTTSRSASAAAKPSAGKSSGNGAPPTLSAAARAAAVQPRQIADNLINLLAGASLAVATSLERVLGEASKRSMLPPDVSRVLWDVVGQGSAAITRFRTTSASSLATLCSSGGWASAITSSASTSSLSSSSVLVIASQLQASYLSAQETIVRARRAMNILAFLASSDDSVVDNLPAMGRVLAALQPIKLPATASAAIASAGGLMEVSSRIMVTVAAHAKEGANLPLLGEALQLLITGGDYRLAKHICVTLQRLPPPLIIPSTFSGAGSAESKTASDAVVTVAAKAGSKASKASVAAATAAAAAADVASIASASDPASKLRRAEVVGKLLTCISEMIRGEWGAAQLEDQHWYAAAQAGIDAICTLSPRPLAPCTALLQHMGFGLVGATASASASSATSASTAASPPAFSKLRLSRLFFVVGHVSLKMLIVADSLAARVKTLRIAAVERGATSASSSASAVAASNPSSSSSSKSSKGAASKGAAPAGNEAGSLEDQLGATAEDEKEFDLFTLATDKELLGAYLIGTFLPLVTTVVTSQLSVVSPIAPSAAADSEQGTAAEESSPSAAPAEESSSPISSSSSSLAQSALLALCKLMCVSSSVCEVNLPLLFTVISHASVPSLRASIATALGDLTFRFPNLVEPYTHLLYARLRDPHASVRKNTLMVLSHLILNGMVKIKGQIGEVAACLHDPEPRIVDLTRMFFNELSKRGSNPIYNVLPDTLSCLSRLVREGEQAASAADSHLSPTATAMHLRRLTRSSFRDIVKFLLGFVGKEKQSEGLAEKLLHRFSTVDDIETARELAFSLAQLPLNEKITVRMAEQHKVYKQWLGDADVWASFSAIIAKVKRQKGAASASASSSSSSASSSSMKDVMAEWEKSLQESHQGATEDSASLSKAKDVAAKAAALASAEGLMQGFEQEAAATLAAAASSAAAATLEGKKAPKGSKKAAAMNAASSATSNASNSSSSSSVPEEKSAPPPKRTASRKKAIVESDDDDDDASDDENGKKKRAPARKAR